MGYASMFHPKGKRNNHLCLIFPIPSSSRLSLGAPSLTRSFFLVEILDDFHFIFSKDMV